ncbi:hypothetical protein NMG60_11035426 [Bertholletia excelsa]
MKKTFFFNFVPTKEEEIVARERNQAYLVSRVLVEIRDVYPLPSRDYFDPWKIKKRIASTNIVSGRLMLSHSETFEHIFRYWSVDMTNYVLSGNKANVVVWDITDENNPKRYCNGGIFFEKSYNEEFYVFGWTDLARNRHVYPGDEIGLYWDIRSGSFHFSLFRQRFNMNFS